MKMLGHVISGTVGISLLASSVTACNPKLIEPPTTPPIQPPGQAIIVNPVEEYAKSIKLPDEYISILKPLGNNKKTLEENDKKAVDLSYSIMQMTINNSSKKADISYLASGRVKEFDNAYGLLKLASDKSLERILELGIDDNIVNYISFVYSLNDKEFAKSSLENALCIQDKKLADLERNFLTNPDTYKQQLFDYYISEINKTNPELAIEIGKLPKDLRIANMKSIEALEDIWGLTLKSEYKKALDDILNTGIKERRKYCSPLETIAWIAYDKDFDKEYLNPFVSYSLEKLVRMAWIDTSESKNYSSDRWGNFNEVADRLNSPVLVSTYMQRNFSYDWDKYRRWIAGDYRWDLAMDTFNKKKSDCGGQAIFALHCLLGNGYLYDNFDINKNHAACLLGCWDPSTYNNTKQSHTVLLYRDNNFFYTIDSGETTTLKGPFATIESAANSTFRGWTQYVFYNTTATSTKVVSKN